MSNFTPSAANPKAASVLLIFGAGGHGKVLVDAALLSGQWSRIVMSDRQPPTDTRPSLPGIDLITVASAELLNPAVHIAIGNNDSRQKEAEAWGHNKLASVVHPAASVSVFSTLGAGSFVAAGAVVGPAARLGMGVIINHGAVVDHDVVVGAFSHIAPNASLGGHVSVGQRVLIGSGAVVLPSVTIGDDVTIGAGSVVTANLPDPGTYVGIPARRIYGIE